MALITSNAESWYLHRMRQLRKEQRHQRRLLTIKVVGGTAAALVSAVAALIVALH